MALPFSLAAQLYTVRQFTKTPADVAVTLRKVREIGYRAVQVSGFGPIDKRELRKLLDDNGLVCACTHLGFEQMRDQTAQVIEEHHTLGCAHIAVGSMPGSYRGGGAEGFSRFAREASEVARRLKAQGGLTWSYHNHSFELIRQGAKTGLEILFEESDPAVFNLEIDTYWITHGGGDPADWIRKCRGRIPLVHFKDMASRQGEKQVEQLMAEVGEGNQNWPAILEACAASGVVWRMVEQDVCQRDPFESLAISFKNLTRWGVK
jgi:sugar phosphate isomerase/epimerase